MRTPARFAHRSFAIVATTLLFAAACGGGKDAPVTPTNPGGENPGTPTTPNAITGVVATPVTSTSIRVSFTSRAGDSNYSLERAEGASGSFSSVGSLAAPASPGALSHTDLGLKPNTLYRYRVIAMVGTAAAPPSTEASATTLALAATGTADITTDITSNRILYAETTYTIKGFIHVANGATLTIRPGTVIKGDYNTPGSTLFIMRGARINAVGDAGAPIVFTSSRPAGTRQPGDWGGLVIIGNALGNRSGAIPLDGTGTDGSVAVGGKNYLVVYNGGSTPNDDSGTLSYVRVEFAGHAPLADQDRGAFTFASVGQATRVSYLQTMGSADDAFLFLGGAFDGDHLVAYETGDDMFDMTEGFSGRLQYLIGLNTLALTPRPGAVAGAADITGIESDGCIGAGCDAGYNTQPFTVPLVANFTLVGCGWAPTCGGNGGGMGMQIRRGSGGYFVNGLVSRFPTVGVSLRDLETFNRGGGAPSPNMGSTDLALKNIFFAESGATIFQTNAGGPNVQFSLDLAENGLVLGTSIAQSLFTTFPTPLTAPGSASELDWTPQSSAAIASGGMTVFPGRIQQKAGSVVTPTSYRGGAAPGGSKWWERWTTYVRN
jgi:hypothetical protein